MTRLRGSFVKDAEELLQPAGGIREGKLPVLASNVFVRTAGQFVSGTNGLPGKTYFVIPLGRAGAPADVARAVVYLASKFDGFINGATLDINGGVYSARNRRAAFTAAVRGRTPA